MLSTYRQVHVEMEGARWFNSYFSFLERRGRWVVSFWIVVYAVSLFYGPTFLTKGDDSARPPKGTPSWYAQDEFEHRFKAQALEVPLLVLIRTKTDVYSESLFGFAKQLRADVIKYNETVGKGNVLSTISMYELSGTLLDGAKLQFVSKDKKATFINIMVRGDRITHERYDFVKFLKADIKKLNPDEDDFIIGLTGFDAMAYESADDNQKNVAKIDLVTIPIAMALLGYMIRSWRLLIFSFFNLGCAILSSFAFMSFMVEYGGAPHPESASAQLMEVITMAVSIDWSLFLHRRFRDEIKRGVTPREAAYLSLLHSGHVVIMSGSTLIVVFIGFISLPAPSVQMDGACCCVGVTVAMLIALTNTPAIWLLFPNFCADFDQRCCKTRTVEDLERDAYRMGLTDVVNSNGDGRSLSSSALSMNGIDTVNTSNNSGLLSARAPLIASDDYDDLSVNGGDHQPVKKTHHVMYGGLRFRFTRWITTFPNNIFSIILVYILVIPFALQVSDIVINQDVLVTLPRHSAAAQTYHAAFEDFAGGTFAPFYIMVTTKERITKDKALTPSFFDAARFAAEETLKACKAHDSRFDINSVVGPAFLAGKGISYGAAKTFLNTARSLPCNPPFNVPVSGFIRGACSVAKEFEFEWEQAVNEEQNAMLTTVTVPFFPFAQESSDFIAIVYDVLEKAKKAHPDFDFYFCGVEVGFNALMHRVFDLFPRLLASTFIIVFSILGVLLRSAFVPVRLALTLVAPLCAVFGLAVVVYQKGALEWTGIAAFHRIDGFFWYVPILLLSMIVGLSLDWDVLLVSRIMEHRERGYDIRAAICKACCETGGTISAAGIIMCLAFGGMLLSDQPIINACGFILFTALLLDTFVVNTCLVPALISIGDKVAWYPMKMPMTDLKTLDNCDEFPR